MKVSIKKERLDKILVQRGIVESRELAQRMILAGNVLVNEQLITKVAEKIDISADIRLKEQPRKYVSRGGEKLEIAIKKFNIKFSGKSVLDIGISTGGFTDCALQHNAKEVTGVDVGYGQVDLKIRNNPLVSIIEKTNARTLNLNKEFDIIICDVSFISILKLIDTFNKHLKKNGELIVLIKPQFEAGREYIEKGGIVKDLKIHQIIIENIKQKFSEAGFEFIDIAESKILYPKGNIEYLSYWRKK
ncbi:MAG TPA: TlyA family RNA methyltransferase [bacterium]|nr:TlyA family RNA methyltransferase [bacterium]